MAQSRQNPKTLYLKAPTMLLAHDMTQKRVLHEWRCTLYLTMSHMSYDAYAKNGKYTKKLLHAH